MKYTLVTLFIVFSSLGASAQKDILWADGGMSFSRLLPGASVTYNYNVLRFLGLGAGAQVYDFHNTVPTFQPVPAIFWDVRFNIRSRKKSQYFLFMDAGLNIYRRSTQSWRDDNGIYNVSDDNGNYLGFGIGYFRRQATHRWSHYVSLKMISNTYNVNAYNFASGERNVEGAGDQTLVLSFGFRF